MGIPNFFCCVAKVSVSSLSLKSSEFSLKSSKVISLTIIIRRGSIGTNIPRSSCRVEIEVGVQPAVAAGRTNG